MLKRVVVGFDGSELAREAFAYGVTIARATGARVLAVHAIEPVIAPALGGDPSILLDPMVPPVFLGAPDDEGAAEERARMTAAVDELGAECARAGVEFSAQIEVGGAVEMLAGVAEPEDLIAIGLKGRFKHTGVGSSTRRFVSHAPCPVLVASGGGGAGAKSISRILVPYDGATASTLALEFARDELFVPSGWALFILALERGRFKLDQSMDWAEEIAPGAKVIAQGAQDKSEAQLIERVAAGDPSALLVMGAYADSWLKDLFTGSVTSHVLTHLRAPIILVHGKG